MIAIQDDLHVRPAVRAAELGYHILLEKSLAPSEAECRRIVDAVRQAGVRMAVGHVLRDTAYTRELRAVLDSGGSDHDPRLIRSGPDESLASHLRSSAPRRHG